MLNKFSNSTLSKIKSRMRKCCSIFCLIFTQGITRPLLHVIRSNPVYILAHSEYSDSSDFPSWFDHVHRESKFNDPVLLRHDYDRFPRCNFQERLTAFFSQPCQGMISVYFGSFNATETNYCCRPVVALVTLQRSRSRDF